MSLPAQPLHSATTLSNTLIKCSHDNKLAGAALAQHSLGCASFSIRLKSHSTLISLPYRHIKMLECQTPSTFDSLPHVQVRQYVAEVMDIVDLTDIQYNQVSVGTSDGWAGWLSTRGGGCISYLLHAQARAPKLCCKCCCCKTGRLLCCISVCSLPGSLLALSTTMQNASRPHLLHTARVSRQSATADQQSDFGVTTPFNHRYNANNTRVSYGRHVPAL